MTSNTIINISIAIGLLAFSIALFSLIINQKTRQAILRTITSLVKEITESFDDHITIAKLQVVAGLDELLGTEMLLYSHSTTIGRDDQFSDITISTLFDVSSTISRLHCTIDYNPIQNTFQIRDEDSTNGTFVNGQRVPPLEYTLIKDGDEITLGDVFRRGVKLRFEVEEGTNIEADMESNDGPSDRSWLNDLE